MQTKDLLKSLTFALVGSALCASVATAQSYPSKDIKIIVPFAPGGAVDVTSRIIAEYANKHLDKVKIVVENRAGGDGVVGQTFAARAKPDGYTMLAMTSSVVTNPVLKETQYKIEDFEAVAMYTDDPEVLIVPTDSPFKTVADFIAEAKKRPISVTIAGIATSHHLAGLALEDSAGIKFNYLPTKGFGPQLQAVMGNHVESALWSFGEGKKHVDAKSVRLLAVASDKRLEGFPDVPTWKEAGLNIPRWTTFRGWAVPKGSPKEAVAFLANLLEKVNKDEGYIARMTEYGYPVSYRDAAGYTEVVNDYADLAGRVIKKHNLKEQ
ncbi:MAG: tripartite tricarboxylate transporter substrate binding protein [Rhodospirillales bacterium]|nr:tripartite tricarboxylate transporter substrate binding protein [Rhodospirillales bacterium]